MRRYVKLHPEEEKKVSQYSRQMWETRNASFAACETAAAMSELRSNVNYSKVDYPVATFGGGISEQRRFLPYRNITR